MKSLKEKKLFNYFRPSVKKLGLRGVGQDMENENKNEEENKQNKEQYEESRESEDRETSSRSRFLLNCWAEEQFSFFFCNGHQQQQKPLQVHFYTVCTSTSRDAFLKYFTFIEVCVNSYTLNLLQ